MLATLERVQLIDHAEMLGEMIKQTDLAERYRLYYHKLQEDPDTKRKIAAFNEMKEKYEEVQRFGRYHPDYLQVTRQTRALKREMDMDENVAGFRRAEHELQSLLDQIGVIIGQAVSSNVKVVTGNPFFETGSACGGGCGSGGACGCSA
ncbi:YlbF family regulator [Siminovitchia sediminis]|uniref:YlbF family regulator n=1 Tax=Siminovitchia sediminis TaxID=1274353 RepID=A0ABW4KF15_9BACI